MKRFSKPTVLISLLLVLLLLCACSHGNGNETAADTTVNPHENEESYSVAVLQFDNDYASNSMREKFTARMRTLGYDEAKMKFDIFSAHGDTDSLKANAEALLGSKYRLIAAVGTAAAKAVAATGNEIPCIFIGAEDPVANALTSTLDVPDKNMTGSAFRTSSDTLLSVMRVYTPGITSIAVIYLPQGKAEAEAVNSVLAENAYTVSLYPVSSAEDITAKMAEASQNNDAFFFPSDSWSEDVIAKAVNYANESSKPILASSESFIEKGALLGTFTGSDTLAEEAALCADRVLSGELISSIAIRADLDISLFVNQNTAAAFGTEIPTSDNLVLF